MVESPMVESPVVPLDCPSLLSLLIISLLFVTPCTHVHHMACPLLSDRCSDCAYYMSLSLSVIESQARHMAQQLWAV